MGTLLTGEPGPAFEAFVRWACTVEWDNVSPAARRRAVLVLSDNIVASFSALGEPQVQKYQRRLIDRHVGAGQATLLRPDRARLAVAQAAMGNAMAMGWNELDEGFRKAVCHAGLYVLPALLAVAEAEGASTQDLLRALTLGYETAARAAQAWRFLPPLRIHPHALLAPLGAAAGVGFLRRLPADDMVSALGCAATLGMAGPFNHALRGVLARNAWAVQGAQSGLNALDWADCGIGGSATSPHDVFATALGAQPELLVLTPGAENGWAIESGYHKLNACCQYAHSTIEAIQSLLQDHAELRGGDGVASVELEAHPLAFALDDRNPVSTLGAKFSVPHAAAATLVHGDGGVASFDATSLRDPRIARLRDATVMKPFDGVRPWPDDRPARVTVQTTDGQRFAAECWSARGGPDRPFTELELWDKLSTLGGPHAPACVEHLRRLADAAAGPAASDAMTQSWRGWLADALAPRAGHTGAAH